MLVVNSRSLGRNTWLSTDPRRQLSSLVFIDDDHDSGGGCGGDDGDGDRYSSIYAASDVTMTQITRVLVVAVAVGGW